MHIVRLIITSLACGGFAAFLGRHIIKGIRTGRIRYAGWQVCERRKNPLVFRLLVLAFSVWIAIALVPGNVLFKGFVTHADAAQPARFLSEDQAIAIAQKAISSRGYNPNEFYVVVDKENAIWNAYVEGNRNSDLGQEFKSQFERWVSKLRGHDFWHIGFKLKPLLARERLGGLGVFVDSTSGKVLLVIGPH